MLLSIFIFLSVSYYIAKFEVMEEDIARIKRISPEVQD
jgi:hypothetical protein